MSFRAVQAGALVALALLALPAFAQSSLGIAGGMARLSATTASGGGALASAEASLDVAITGAHGLQLDFGLEDTPRGTLGHVGAHLYLAPGPRARYGLFATLGDLDGAGFTLATAGVEGRVALGPRTALDLAAGAGLAQPSGLDFVFASAGLAHRAGDALHLDAHLTLAEYDEPGLRALGHTLALGAEWRPAGSPVTLTATLGHSGLSGRDGRPGEVFAGLGIGFVFGAPASPMTRPLRRADPLGPLARRGLF